MTVFLRAWAALLRCLTLGRPNYLLVAIRRKTGRSWAMLVPLVALRDLVDDACWMGSLLPRLPGFPRRFNLPPALAANWDTVIRLLPAALGFRRPFELVDLHTPDLRLRLSVL